MRDNINKVINIKNRISAAPIETPVIPEKPSIATIIAIIINAVDHLNMISDFYYLQYLQTFL